MPRDIPVRKTTIEEADRLDRHVYARLTPADRLGMMWQLAVQAWAFKEGRVDEPVFHRDVVRTLRGRR
jgi:hypothetical protein